MFVNENVTDIELHSCLYCVPTSYIATQGQFSLAKRNSSLSNAYAMGKYSICALIYHTHFYDLKSFSTAWADRIGSEDQIFFLQLRRLSLYASPFRISFTFDFKILQYLVNLFHIICR
jgi:hypothetical protein